MKKILLTPIVAMTALLVMNPAIAGTSTDTLSVTADVTASCKLNMPNQVNLSTYNPTNDLSLGIETIVVCSKGVAYSVGASKGRNGTSTSNRVLTSWRGFSLNYELTLNGTTWGDVDGSMQTGIGIGSNDYFRPVVNIPKGQFVEPGVYEDILTISLTY